MKRFILIAIVLLASGCTNINKNLTSKDDIDKNFNTLQATITDSNYEMYNNYRRINPGARYEDLKDIVNKEVDRMSL